MTPNMQKNIYTSAHQAKFGKFSLTSDMMEDMKAISHASLTCMLALGPHFSQNLANAQN